MGRKSSVSLVIRNNIAREGLRGLLESAWTVHSAGSPRELMEGGAVLSDIVLLSEVYVAEEDYSVLTAVLMHNPGAKVILIGQRFTNLQHLANVVKAGTWGYISSEAPFCSLLGQLKLVAMGDRVFPFELISALAGSRSVKAEMDPISLLTEHEREVLSGIACGLATKAIALSAGITEARAKLVTKSLFRKMRVKNRTQAALMAREHGWLAGHGNVGARSEAQGTHAVAIADLWWGTA